MCDCFVHDSTVHDLWGLLLFVFFFFWVVAYDFVALVVVTIFTMFLLIDLLLLISFALRSLFQTSTSSSQKYTHTGARADAYRQCTGAVDFNVVLPQYGEPSKTCIKCVC